MKLTLKDNELQIHEMKLNDVPFNLIKNKSKNIEMRLYDEKRRKIKKEHVIVFTNTNTNEQIKTIVTNLYIYDTFEELYKNHNKINLGYLENEVASHRDMELYYSKEKQEEYGVVGIELELISHMDFLSYQYKIDRNKRIENTVRILTSVADKEMTDEEKEKFLNDIK